MSDVNQRLFNYMKEEHGVTLLESDINEIKLICAEGQSEQLLAFKGWERDKCKLPWDAEPKEIIEQYLNQ